MLRNCMMFGRSSLRFKTLLSNGFKAPKAFPKPTFVSSISSSSVDLTKEFGQALEIPSPTDMAYHVEKAGGIQNFSLLLKNLRKEYGNIFQLELGPERLMCLADPYMIEDIFRKEGKYPRRQKPFPAWVDYHEKRNLPMGVFLAEDEDWYKERNALNPKLLNIRQVEHYADDFNNVTDELMRKLLSLRDHNMEIDHIEKELFKWSLESACTVLFETHIGCFSKSSDRYVEFINVVHKLFDVFLQVYFDMPTEEGDEPQSLKDFRYCLDVIYKVTDEEIENKLKKYKSGDAKVDENTAKEFIPYLYYVQKQSLAQIKSNIASLMMAAVDNTSTSVQFLLFNLANNQDVQRKLYEEISSQVKPGEPATPAMLKRMPYLRAVMKESFRMNSTVPSNSRWFTEETCIAGYKIPAYTSIFLLHDEVCNDKAYFDEPDVFKPERWLRENKGENDIHPFASLPFGYGPRGCLGRRLAELEIQLILTRIFGKYVVECDKKKVSIMANSFLNKPGEDLKFKIYER